MSNIIVIKLIDKFIFEDLDYFSRNARQKYTFTYFY